MAFLAEEAGAAPGAALGGLGLEQARTHAAGCRVCGPELRRHCSMRARLRNMAITVASERNPDCPAEERWTEVAGGVCSVGDAAPLIDHASRCDHCGPLLRAATEDLNPEISIQEQKRIAELPSARVAWQRNLARAMAQATLESSDVAEGEDTATRTGAAEHASPEKAGSVLPRRANWAFGDWSLWAAGTAMAVVATAIWIGYSSPSLFSTNKMIAQAYSEQRPIEIRFPGAGYGPVRQTRGESAPAHSRMDEPAELLEAETNVARGLASHPQDAGWLQAKARVEVFEGNYDPAIDALRQADAARPGDSSIKADLATAYFGRAEGKTDISEKVADYELALAQLQEVLGKKSDDPVALFNRALVYQRLKKYPEAVADWQRYLELDPRGEWADAARREIEEAQRAGAME